MVRKHNTSGGGANTNENGLKFERDTDLASLLDGKGFKCKDGVVYYAQTKLGILVEKNKFYKVFLKQQDIDWKNCLSKKILPDEAFVNEEKHTVYIIEKKFQETPGSVDEKLQTCHFKLKQYKKLLKGTKYKVKFIFLLCDFFKNKKYDDVLKYVKNCKCGYYFETLPLRAIGLEGIIKDE